MATKIDETIYNIRRLASESDDIQDSVLRDSVATIIGEVEANIYEIQDQLRDVQRFLSEVI